MSQGQKIFLLVDDDDEDRNLFYEALQSIDSKFICFMAEDGQQALNLLAEKTHNLPNVIFLDINMPVMSGWECLKSLKTEPLYKNIPVIMYSTSSHKRDMEIAIELGALCFCVKPENFKKITQLLEVVSSHISGNLHEGIKQFNKEYNCHFKGL